MACYNYAFGVFYCWRGRGGMGGERAEEWGGEEGGGEETTEGEVKGEHGIMEER